MAWSIWKVQKGIRGAIKAENGNITSHQREAGSRLFDFYMMIGLLAHTELLTELTEACCQCSESVAHSKLSYPVLSDTHTHNYWY